MDPLKVEEFLAWNRAEGYRFPKSAEGASPLLEFLRGLGVVPMPLPPAPSPTDALLERFARYLLGERGLARRTTELYVHNARMFLTTFEQADGLDLGPLSAARVTSFVVVHCPIRSIPAAKNLVSGLRALLCFLYVEGITTSPLAGAVPTVSGWSGGGLPRGVDADSVRRLLASCDRRCPKGRRDLAMLSLLARLGMRAGEVAALELDDLDWSRGELLVRGKAQRLERLPLPDDVGKALADYLTHGRPRGGVLTVTETSSATLDLVK
jgi:integrase/recombinase XerD